MIESGSNYCLRCGVWLANDFYDDGNNSDLGTPLASRGNGFGSGDTGSSWGEGFGHVYGGGWGTGYNFDDTPLPLCADALACAVHQSQKSQRRPCDSTS